MEQHIHATAKSAEGLDVLKWKKITKIKLKKSYRKEHRIESSYLFICKAINLECVHMCL